MRKILLATSAIWAGIAVPAYAQTAPAADDQGGIAEIVVTAQKKEESLQKAAVAIDAIAPDQLVSRGVATANDLNKVSPAISITNGGASNTSIFVRGVGNTTNNNYLDPAVTPSYDGVVMGRASGAFGAAFYDLQRVEVLKGPQGILYGRNATGGAVNIIPKKPELGKTGAGIDASYGNYNALSVEGYLNVATSENSALRVSGTIQQHDGYNRDGTDDLDRKGGRLQFLIKPSTDLAVKLGADYTKIGGMGVGASYLGHYSGPTFAYTPASFDAYEGLNTTAANAYRKSSVLLAPAFYNLNALNHDESIDYTYWGVNAEVKVKTRIGELTVIPAYRSSKGESFFYGPAFSTAYNKEDVHQSSIEARLAGSVGKVDYILGGFFFDEKIHNNNEFNQEAVLPIQSYDTGTKSYAAFGQLKAHLTDKLSLVGGLRYTHDSKFMNGIINNFVVFCGGIPPVTPPASFGRGCNTAGRLPHLPNALSEQEAFNWLVTNGWIASTSVLQANAQVFPLVNGTGVVQKSYSPVNANGTYSRVTWKAGLEYQVTDANLLYASVEDGYRAGGFQLAEGNPAYNPEFIRAYSIGSKNRFFDNKLQINAEAFLWKYRDQQIGYFTVDFASGVLINRTANAGRATMKGFDVDIVAKPVRHTTLSAQVQYLDTKYDDLHLYTAPPRSNIACPSSPLLGSSGSQIVVGGQGALDFNCSGNPLLFSPKWSINMGVEQVIPLGSFELVAAGRTSWRDSQIGAFEYLAFEKIPAYWTSDANLTLRKANGGLAITAFVTNIENKRRISRPQASPQGFATATYTSPRTYGLRVSADF